MINEVGFPGLGIELSLSRIAFSVFGKDIYWYGIIIGIGLLLALCYCYNIAEKNGIAKETILDVVLYGVPVSIIGARAYFVLWNLGDYADEPLSIFAIWEGGIAIYGGIISAFVFGYFYCKAKKISYLKLADIAVFGFLIGQCIGRWGNFMNVEAYGCETDLPWRMEIFAEELGKRVCVHPTFLYESLWNLAGFIILSLYRPHKNFDGEIFLGYIFWYGLGRSWIEQLRVDSLPYSGGFKVSQIVAVVSALCALFFIIKINMKKRNDTKKTE